MLANRPQAPIARDTDTSSTGRWLNTPYMTAATTRGFRLGRTRYPATRLAIAPTVHTNALAAEGLPIDVVEGLGEGRGVKATRDEVLSSAAQSLGQGSIVMKPEHATRDSVHIAALNQQSAALVLKKISDGLHGVGDDGHACRHHPQRRKQAARRMTKRRGARRTSHDQRGVEPGRNRPRLGQIILDHEQITDTQLIDPSCRLEAHGGAVVNDQLHRPPGIDEANGSHDRGLSVDAWLRFTDKSNDERGLVRTPAAPKHRSILRGKALTINARRERGQQQLIDAERRPVALQSRRRHKHADGAAIDPHDRAPRHGWSGRTREWSGDDGVPGPGRGRHDCRGHRPSMNQIVRTIGGLIGANESGQTAPRQRGSPQRRGDAAERSKTATGGEHHSRRVADDQHIMAVVIKPGDGIRSETEHARAGLARIRINQMQDSHRGGFKWDPSSSGTWR